MIISCASLKGGVGKSTTTINLACGMAHIGYRTAIIDTDTNGSCIRWSGLRPESLPVVTTMALSDAKALRKNINTIHEDYEIVVVDGTPQLSELTSSIILVSDLVISPIKPSALDFWATEKFMQRYEDVRLLKEKVKAYFLLNQYKPTTNLSKDAAIALQDFGLPILKTKLFDRVSYSESILKGLSALEYKDAKAKNEAIQLTNEVLTLIK